MIAAKLNNLEIALAEFEFGKTNKDAGFLAKFPLGKVPALEAHDPKQPLYLAESSAIGAFVADAGPAREQLLGANVHQRAKVTQWLMHAELEINPQVRVGLMPKMGYATYDAEAEAKALVALDRIMAVVEGTLAGGQPWLVPGTTNFSLADLTVLDRLAGALKLWLDKSWRDRYPATMEWFARLMAVPVVGEVYHDYKFVDAAKE